MDGRLLSAKKAHVLTISQLTLSGNSSSLVLAQLAGEGGSEEEKKKVNRQKISIPKKFVLLDAKPLQGCLCPHGAMHQ